MSDPALENEVLRKKILDLVQEYAQKAHAQPPFIPGKTPVPVSGRTYYPHDLQLLVDASLDFWLTTGRFNDAFEKRLAKFLGIPYVLTVNSGSSANLLAVAALTSPLLGEKALKAGDEVITAAAAFPTTVNPLLLYGLMPVFVDVEIPTYNVLARDVEKAITDKTRAIVLAHTLGNPFEADRIRQLAQQHNLWFVEDCCDALGSTLGGQKVGLFGHVGTLSFYPAHHITMGEGGAVFTRDPLLRRILISLRDWGRDCYCAPGKDNTCGKRFDWKWSMLPAGYDHKYVYSHLGYNLKITDMQAAVGLSQMERLEEFISQRRENFAYLATAFSSLEKYFILPQATAHSEPSWFGFPLTIRPQAGILREDLLRWLESRKIGTRLLFSGNITKQPYLAHYAWRAHGTLENTDRIMRNTFWLGVYPRLTHSMLQYVVDSIAQFVAHPA